MENNTVFLVTDELVATQGKRFLNLLIDRVMFYVAVFALSLLVGVIFRVVGYYEGLDRMQNLGKLEDVILSVIIIVLYYLIFETFTGRTIGKYITNTSVVNEFGEKPAFDIILKRTLIRIIPFDALTFLSTPSRGWHDAWVDTYVVDNTKFKDAKENFDGFNQLGINKD